MVKAAASAPPPEQSAVVRHFRTNVVPLALMLVSPPAVQFVWVACVPYGGDARRALLDAPGGALWAAFPAPTKAAAGLALGFALAQAVLLSALPGEIFRAIPTPMGNRPVYRLNGVLAFVVTHLALFAAHFTGLIRYGALFDHFGPMLAFLGKFALLFTALLYFKGLYYPTNSDSGTAGHGFVWDIWHGTELHPELFGVSLKQFINCRFAMMGWSVAVVAFAFKQHELYGFLSNSMAVSAILQLVYIYKFFVWESGYFNSIDIIHDRFGFYIFWGCSAFLPSIYTLTSLFLVEHPAQYSHSVAALNLIIGLGAVWANYSTDAQRQRVRAANGNALVWGKPAKLVHASYITGDGKARKSILLASGWWGVSRHLNYVWELILALCWCLPTGDRSILGYVYFFFLLILLVDRAYRDELRCLEKYGEYYEEYCRLVPYKMVPFLY
jgi:7-dehydrocholesterol reductase